MIFSKRISQNPLSDCAVKRNDLGAQPRSDANLRHIPPLSDTLRALGMHARKHPDLRPVVGDLIASLKELARQPGHPLLRRLVAIKTERLMRN